MVRQLVDGGADGLLFLEPCQPLFGRFVAGVEPFGEMAVVAWIVRWNRTFLRKRSGMVIVIIQIQSWDRIPASI